MPKDPELLAHQQWLGYLQPVGLVVSPPALVQCQAFVDTNISVEHARFLELVQEVSFEESKPVFAIPNLKALLTDPGLFKWEPADLVPADDPRATSLEVVLTEYHETLKPTYAVPEGQGWLMLIQEIPLATDLDESRRMPGTGRHLPRRGSSGCSGRRAFPLVSWRTALISASCIFRAGKAPGISPSQ
jgi:hypothetical protein